MHSVYLSLASVECKTSQKILCIHPYLIGTWEELALGHRPTRALREAEKARKTAFPDWISQ